MLQRLCGVVVGAGGMVMLGGGLMTRDVMGIVVGVLVVFTGWHMFRRVDRRLW